MSDSSAHSPRILISGAQGRIGQALFQAASPAWQLQGVSRTTGDCEHMTWEHFLQSTGSLDADAFIHAAWNTLPALAADTDPGPEDENLLLLKRLVARLQHSPVPPLLVFMSTGAVYGEAPGRPSRETDVPQPKGGYARGKLAAESFLQQSGLPVCILRVGNVYGLPSRENDPQGVLGYLVRSAVQGISFRRWGRDSIKDYLHFRDFQKAVQQVVEKRLQGIWNLGSGQGTALSELMDLVESATGRNIQMIEEEARPWDVQDNRLDTTALEKTLSWTASVRLSDGVTEAVQDCGS